MGLNRYVLKSLIYLVQRLEALKHLDISFNFFDIKDLQAFFSQITNKNQLMSLNIGFNSASQTKHRQDPFDKFTFESKFAKFLESSTTLLHLDFSGLMLSLE